MLALQVPETEDSWERIAKAINELKAVFQDGGCDLTTEIVPICRTIAQPLNSATNSERTRLSGPAVEAVTAMATGCGTNFDSLLPLYFPAILNLCIRTNKVALNRARACILAIIEYTQLPAILSYFSPCFKDKSSSLRLVAAEGVLACLNSFNPPDLERGGRPAEIENIIRLAARDATADVRKIGKKIYEAYKEILPARVDRFVH